MSEDTSRPVQLRAGDLITVEGHKGTATVVTTPPPGARLVAIKRAGRYTSAAIARCHLYAIQERLLPAPEGEQMHLW